MALNIGVFAILGVLDGVSGRVGLEGGVGGGDVNGGGSVVVWGRSTGRNGGGLAYRERGWDVCRVGGWVGGTEHGGVGKG